MTDRFQERLRLLAEKAAEPPPARNQCKAPSRASKGSMYGPDGMFRCQKEAGHKDRHVDDYGTEWVTYPRFKIIVQRHPG